jgi:hypothetical protein
MKTWRFRVFGWNVNEVGVTICQSMLAVLHQNVEVRYVKGYKSWKTQLHLISMEFFHAHVTHIIEFPPSPSPFPA